MSDSILFIICRVTAFGNIDDCAFSVFKGHTIHYFKVKCVDECEFHAFKTSDTLCQGIIYSESHRPPTSKRLKANVFTDWV